MQQNPRRLWLARVPHGADLEPGTNRSVGSAHMLNGATGASLTDVSAFYRH